MYWEEGNAEDQYRVPEDVVDLVFAIRCRCLPVDHAYALQAALVRALPWLADEPQAGVHPIHVADSGNGWMRPDSADDLLYPSRRTKLILRLPQQRLADAQTLVGQTLDLGKHSLTVQSSNARALSPITTIFSRYIVTEADDNEESFLRQMLTTLGARGIKPKKMLCGMAKTLGTPSGLVHTRSLMLADLQVEESVSLQQSGLGPQRLLGCGLFIPHKDIGEVRPRSA